MKNNFSTIFIVSSDNKNTKFINLRTKHIENFKRYLIFAILFLGLISLSLFFFISMFLINSQEISKKDEIIFGLKKQVNLIDSLTIKEKVFKIESNLNKIDYFLKDKGVLDDYGIGGNDIDNGNYLLDYRVYDFFILKTSEIINIISNIPLGLPYYNEIKSEFGYRNNPFGGKNFEFHNGIDIKADIGTPVKATADGIIIFTGWDGGYGKCVKIKHKFGYETIYGHLSAFNSNTNDSVKSGDIIAFSGSSGRSTGPHIHYEIKFLNNSVNPVNFIKIK